MTQAKRFDVPVAFFVFNRPDLTRMVFDVISQIKPSKLFLIADGPRTHIHGETEKVAEVIRIFDSIDWPCEVYTDFSETNLGCKIRIASGVSWVFKHVNKAILLEDDCLPSLPFFEFCREMLILYKDDSRVFSVSGSNFCDPLEDYGHTFSRYSLMWGWATWADRWSKYVLEPKDSSKVIRDTWGLKHPLVLYYWLRIFKNLTNGEIDTWDYQWILTGWRESGLTCRPSHNLVENLGFRADATHTISSNTFVSVSANHFLCDYSRPLTPVEPNRLIEEVDEKKWAQINFRSILLMVFPILGKTQKLIRRD